MTFDNLVNKEMSLPLWKLLGSRIWERSRMRGDLQSGRDWGCLTGAQVEFVNGNFLVNFLQLSRQPLGKHGT